MAEPREQARGLGHVVADLREQLARYDALPSERRAAMVFSISSDEAREAIGEFHRTSCAAERLLDRCVIELFAPDLERILVTVSACPALAQAVPHHAHVRNARVIGTQIPTAAYDDLLATPDQRLSDGFQASCPYCPEDGGTPRAHDAILSYLRHVPRALRDIRLRLDDHDGNVQGLRYSLALLRADTGSALIAAARETEQLIADELDMKRRTERALERVAGYLDVPFIQVKTRVKGDGRLAQKIVRAALGLGSTGSVKDPYGIQCVVRTHDLDETRELAATIANGLVSRRADALLEPVRYDESERGEWKGYKMYAAYGDGQLAIPIAFQFLPMGSYWRERSDHPVYEERQRRELDRLRAQGKPVDAMLAAVEHGLARAAAEWRASNASA